MSIYARHLQPPQQHQRFVGPDGRLSMHGQDHLQRMWEWLASGFVIIPCTLDTTSAANEIVLRPAKRRDRGESGYTHLLPFSFVAGATNTGATTIQVGELGAVPAYKGASAAAIGAGDIVSGVPYIGVYCEAVGALPNRMVLK